MVYLFGFLLGSPFAEGRPTSEVDRLEGRKSVLGADSAVAAHSATVKKEAAALGWRGKGEGLWGKGEGLWGQAGLLKR